MGCRQALIRRFCCPASEMLTMEESSGKIIHGLTGIL